MKRLKIGLFFIFLSTVSAYCQYDLQYRVSYDSPKINFITKNITSDFGLRRDASLFHRGIDYSVLTGDDDMGYRLITPVTGNVKKIHGTNYIILVIDGPNNNDFGYGHIFDKSNLFDYDTKGMVLLYVDGKPGTKAILNLNSNPISAIGPEIGTVTYNDVVYPVGTFVSAGTDVAPMGNSGIDNVHLHLYLCEDPIINPNTILNNAKNPLQFINHEETNYDITINALNNLSEYGQNVFMAGDLTGSIKVQVRMAGANNGSIYTNHVMDIEKVHLYIKKYGQNDNDYKLILGNNFESKIVLGGRMDNARYPSGNSSYDIASAFGSITRTGIEPFAYKLYPYDNWYFSDIYTRIHKNDNFTGSLKLAACNAEARYSDGVYFIKPRAFRIDNTEAVNPANPNNNTPKQIIIDNFRPYIANVKIKEYGATDFKYNRGWQWVNNSLLFEQLTIPEQKFDNNKDVEKEVTT